MLLLLKELVLATVKLKLFDFVLATTLRILLVVRHSLVIQQLSDLERKSLEQIYTVPFDCCGGKISNVFVLDSKIFDVTLGKVFLCTESICLEIFLLFGMQRTLFR